MTQKPIVLPFNTPQRVFVYGSLRDRLSNNYYMYLDEKNPSSMYIPESGDKETFTVEGFDMYPITNEFPFSYPFCVEGSGTIEVELYEVSPITMYYLDQLEGYRPDDLSKSMYSRKVVTCTDGIDGIIYYMTPAQAANQLKRGLTKIEHGDWRKFMVDSLTEYVSSIK